ncbi:MAG: hypothetical protein QM786_11880 [Breznakibacter sp.]
MMKTINKWSSFFLFGGILFTPSCETNGDYETTDSFSTISTQLAYVADNSASYYIKFGQTAFDTLSGTRMTSGKKYVALNEMTDHLRAWLLNNDGTPTLQLDTMLTVKPTSVVNLIQVAPGGTLQLIDTQLTPADSASTAVRFFYADELQAPGSEELLITVLAVDQYALMTTKPSYSIDNVAESLKTVVAELELSRGTLSVAVELNVNLYGNMNKGLSARFFYRIADAETGVVIQDYRAGSTSSTSTAEIKIESARKNNVPYPTYKSYVMQWTYKSEAIPFASPTVLMRGERW